MVELRRLEDRIRELCGRVTVVPEAEFSQTMNESRLALHEHAVNQRPEKRYLQNDEHRLLSVVNRRRSSSLKFYLSVCSPKPERHSLAVRSSTSRS